MKTSKLERLFRCNGCGGTILQTPGKITPEHKHLFTPCPRWFESWVTCVGQEEFTGVVERKFNR